MNALLLVLVTGLSAGALLFAVTLIRAAIASRSLTTSAEPVILGAVTNFFDALGIGSFAPTMAWIKFRQLTPDRLIPATMLAGQTLPTICESIVFLILIGVAVDPWLLAGCVGAFVIGAWLGRPLVERLPLRAVQGVVGVSLLLAAAMYAASNLDLMPLGGTASSLPPVLLAIAVAVSVVMGVLVNFGVGNYAPTLIMLSLMGIDPKLAFPIMASAAAFGIIGISGRNIGRSHRNAGQDVPMPAIDLRLVIGMAIGGIPAVLIAAFLVKAMPIVTLRWMVVVVVIYAGAVMLRAAIVPVRPSSRPDVPAH